MRTRLTDLLGLEVPLVQAPMGGGPGTPALVVAVAEAGALGSLAGGYLTAEQLNAEIDAVRAATDRAFAVNLFVERAPDVDPARLAAAVEAVNRLRAELDLPPLPSEAPPPLPDAAAKVDLLVEAAPAVVSFTFGPPAAADVDRLHDAGCLVAGTATTVGEAVALERLGVDLVCAQSAEAGAHSGAFDPAAAPSLGAMALVPQVVDATTVPVVAAGAVMDGRGLAAALALGAAGAQCGTAFLLTPEAGTAAAHRDAVTAASDTDTALTLGVTGRYARGIANRLVEELAGVDVPAYPVMHALTAELRRVAAGARKPELMALWAGQAAPLARPEPAADVVRRIAGEASAILAALAP